MGSGTSVVDPLTGLWAAALFLAARRNSGGGAGQYIATSMLESVIACVPEPGVSERWAVKNQNTLPDALFQGCFRIAGDDRWLVLSAEDVTAAVALATQVGLTPDGDAAQWLRRPETRRTLSVAVQNAIGDLSAEQVEARFGGPGLLAQRVRSFEEVFADPAIQAAGLFAEIDHAVAGRRHYPISPLDALGDSRRPAPLLGEHSEQVWCGLVGLDADTFHRLRQEGVIA
jgi:crotonobetainyl-CoA:carnitine CoA-transferase CaiB-like acyl-CoA transferase